MTTLRAFENFGPFRMMQERFILMLFEITRRGIGLPTRSFRYRVR